MKDIPALEAAILKLHGVRATHVATVSVHEVFNGQTVWDGEVEVFTISEHPSGATRCDSWAYQDDSKVNNYTAVLAVPPVNSPQDAVRAAIVAQVRNEKGKPGIGRPALPQGEGRTKTIQVRVTPAIQAKLDAIAAKRGESVSDIIREVLDKILPE